LKKQREFNLRELRGLAIVARGGMVRRLNQDTYLVRSSDVERFYRVSWNGKGWICECEDYKRRGKPCKHVYAVLFFNRLPSILMSNLYPTEVRCEYCGSTNVIRKGFDHNKGYSSQRYLCKDCGRKFTDRFESRGLKGDPLAVTAAVDLYFKGLSTRQIADHLKRIYGLEVSYPTVYRWVIRYIDLLKRLEEGLELKPGSVWHIDETEIKVKGETVYLWNVIDEETRLLLACAVTYGRSAQDAEIAIKEAIKNAKTKPQTIVTDGSPSYGKAIRNLFKQNEVQHVSKVKFTDKQNNNLVERVHETIKGRLKNARNLNSPETAALLAEGLRLYYNLIRTHTTIEKTPAEKATNYNLRFHS